MVFAVAMVWGSFSPAAFAQNKQLKVNVADIDIQAGYIGRRLPLLYDNKPAVSIADITYAPVTNLPDDALTIVFGFKWCAIKVQILNAIIPAAII